MEDLSKGLEFFVGKDVRLQYHVKHVNLIQIEISRNLSISLRLKRVIDLSLIRDWLYILIMSGGLLHKDILDRIHLDSLIRGK